MPSNNLLSLWTSGKTVVSCNKVHLIVTILAILVALTVTFLVTYFPTRNAFRTKEETKEEEQDDDGPTAAELRLPRSVWPVEYALRLQTFLPGYIDFSDEKKFTFDATVEMKLNITESVRKIVLNIRNITIHDEECSLTVNGKNVIIKSITTEDRLDKVEIALDEQLEIGEDAKLKFVYTGIISEKLGGLYQTRYTEGNKTKVAAVTQMEPTEARLMVPCFDEPEFKAKWKVTVIHPNGTTAISNGIEESVEEDGDWITTTFRQTPSMSSYLLALMVSEFEFVEGYTESGVRFRVYARKEAARANMTHYALSVGIKCLDYYNELFDYSFPLGKQDLVALPDFAAGAMENWGLVTYRENSLLYEKKVYAPENKRRIVQIVAHELGHQWFGDLVTMKWWNDLWLNEGFASYVEFFAADHISNKQMNLPDYFILDPLTKGLERDSVSASHPLSFKIEKANEVSEAFDSISYDKGAAVLKMMAAILGQQNFFKAVSRYVHEYEYKNAEAADLWRVFDEVVEFEGPETAMTISDYADQWTSQMAFPIVTVECNSTHVKLTQKRYLNTPKSKDPEKYSNPKYGFTWDIPVWYKEGNGEEKFAWMKRGEPSYFKITNEAQPFVINVDRKGFYRQNHDAAGWKKLADQLKNDHKIYSPRTRNGIISDAFAAALVDDVPYETVFNLLKYLKEEKEYLPWQEALNGFFDVLKYFGNEPEAKYAENYMRNLLEPTYNKTSIAEITYKYRIDENDSLFNEILFETTIINAYCALGSSKCVANYARLFHEDFDISCRTVDIASQCSRVSAPLKPKAYCYGVREGGEPAFNRVKQLYQLEIAALEKDNLRRALGCHKDARTLKELLQLALDHDPSFVKLQDVADIFNSISENLAGQEVVLNFLLDRWDDIYSRFMPTREAVVSAVKAAGAGIRTQRQLEQVKDLRKHGKHTKEFGVFDSVIEEGQRRVDWIQKHFRRLSEYFRKELQAK